MIDHKDFIFNSDFRYPPIIMQGEYTGGTGFNVTIADNIPEGATYKAWYGGSIGYPVSENFVAPFTQLYISTDRKLKGDVFDSPIIWRVYGY